MTSNPELITKTVYGVVNEILDVALHHSLSSGETDALLLAVATRLIENTAAMSEMPELFLDDEGNRR